MKYVNCPRCRARFHTGVIYEPPAECPRCGGHLLTGRPRPGDRLRAALNRYGVGDSLDWEAITGSQYVRRSVARSARGGGGAATV